MNEARIGVYRRGWITRISVPILVLALTAVVMAVLVSDPWTFSNILDGSLAVVTAPFQSSWLRVRSTGPYRRATLLVLFVALPVLLLPAYAIRPKTSTCVLTVVGTLLWIVSGFLVLALRYVD